MTLSSDWVGEAPALERWGFFVFLFLPAPPLLSLSGIMSGPKTALERHARQSTLNM
tara:strand:+ start:822 stop:989 length:168 start_codon:yes stop_codon:yes gene_type:complete